MILLSKCPICDSTDYENFLHTEDHFLSKEKFAVVQCNSCGFRFTNPRPPAKDLSAYYESKDYISHSNEKKGLVNSLYQMVRKYTISQKYKLISKHKTTGSILDIGCGTGEFLKYFHDKSWETFGIEPGVQARSYALEHHKLHVEPESHLGSLPKSSFDVITMWHVLEHVAELKERMETISGLLKKDGLLVIAVPNCSSWDAHHYGEYWAAWDLPRHLSHFNKKSMDKLISYYPFEMISLHPMKFDAFYVAMLSEKYRRGTPHMVKALLNGFQSNLLAGKQIENYSSLIFVLKRK